MPTWSDILAELNASRQSGASPDFDAVRRKYLALLAAHTGRETILYATRFTQPLTPEMDEHVSILDGDLQGIMETVYGLRGPNLDVILHSPGGSLDAAESLVTYLRSKFAHIRAIVPHLAMSAATMMACAADVLLLGKHSFLGPIDPQFWLETSLGARMVPAQAILEQFQQAIDECQDPTRLAAWLPMLSQFGPDLLVQCHHASDRSEELVREWLHDYMFRDHPERADQSDAIARWLSDHSQFKSHGRHIPRWTLEAHGLVVERLEDDQTLQDLVLSVYHATTHTFSGTSAVKIIENNQGRAFVQAAAPVLVPAVPPPGAPPPPGP